MSGLPHRQPSVFRNLGSKLFEDSLSLCVARGPAGDVAAHELVSQGCAG